MMPAQLEPAKREGCDPSDLFVFLGPTLNRERATSILPAQYQGPAAHGDIFDAVTSGARAIFLVDGYFGSVQSVWHKEILFALSKGIQVYGSSSMGALRAAELAPFGMIGFGEVFQQYVASILDGDDEVAVTHAPEEVGYLPLSLAMVDIRATIASAVSAHLLTPMLAESAIAKIKSHHFVNRTKEVIFSDPPDNWRRANWQQFGDWFEINFVSIKSRDCETALGVLGAYANPGKEFAGPNISLPRTLYWRRRFPREECRYGLSPTDLNVIAEIRLHPARYLPLKLAAAANVIPDEVAEDKSTFSNNAIALTARTAPFYADVSARAARKQDWLRSRSRTNMFSETVGPTEKLVRRWLWKHRTALFDNAVDFRSVATVARLLDYDNSDDMLSEIVVDAVFTAENQESQMAGDAHFKSSEKWNVWLYMASQNDPLDKSINLEEYALVSIEAVQRSLPLQNSRFFIEYDGRDDPGGEPRTYRLEIAGNSVDKVAPTESRDFGKTETLLEFFAWSNSKVNDESRKVLILWGHGLAMEFLPDPNDQQATAKRSIQNIVAFVNALLLANRSGTFVTRGKKFEILGLDCCFMAHLETLARFAAIADFIVASPSAIPLQSWPYDSISEILEARFQPSELGSVAASFATAGRDSFVEKGHTEAPLLAIRSDRLADAVRAQHDLGSAIVDLLVGGNQKRWKPIVETARLVARCHNQAPDYVELESFAERLLSEVSREIALAGPGADSAKVDRLNGVAAAAISASQQTLLFPAPIRGGMAPRSSIVWFPLQRGLYRQSRDLYFDLVRDLGIQLGGVPGWIQLLQVFHDDKDDWSTLGSGPLGSVRGSPLLMGVSGGTRMRRKPPDGVM